MSSALNSRDVQLVIKARDEGSRAIEAFSQALEGLIGKNDSLGRSSAASSSKLSGLVSALADVDRAAASFGKQFETANSKMVQQADGIAAYERQLSSLRSQLAGARSAMDSIGSKIVDTTLGGGNADKLRVDLAAAADAERILQREILATEKALAKQRSVFSASSTTTAEFEKQNRLLGTAQAFARQEVDDLTSAIERQERAKRSSAAVLSTVENSTGVTRDRGDYDQLTAKLRRDAADAAREEAAAIVQLRNEMNPLVAIEARLAAETKKLDHWLDEGKISATEHAGALKLLRNEADRTAKKMRLGGIDSKGRPSFLGLTPNELTNLSYQVNDIFTQLASGTGIMQTLAQQGGQIIQIFPQAGAAIAAALTSGPILAFAASLGVIALGLKRASDEAEQLRTISGILAVNSDAALYNAEALSLATSEMRNLGISAEDALKITRTYIQDGLDPDRLVDFTDMARDLATVMGIDIPDAAKLLGDAFNGNISAIREIDDATNILTDSQRDQIETLIENGDQVAAVDILYKAMHGTLDAGAAAARGPWSEAVTRMKSRWDEFLTTLANTSVVRKMISALDDLANSLFRSSKLTTLADYDQRIGTLQEGRDALVRNRGSMLLPSDQASADREIKRLDNELADLRTERSIVERNLNAPPKPITSDPTSESNKKRERKEEEERDKRTDRKKRGGNSDAERRRRDKEETRTRTTGEIARGMLEEFEGFIPEAKWDVNHYRVGFGSDTVTDSKGRVRTTTKGTRVTRNDALRDLNRRIALLEKSVAKEVGPERWNSFSPEQQASLVSLAYNYGSLEATGKLDVFRTGSSAEITTAFIQLAPANNGVNAKRRKKEAEAFSTDNPALNQSTEDLEAYRQKQQDRLVDSLSEEEAKRKANIAQMEAERDLDGEALLAREREIAVSNALAKAQERVDDINAGLREKGLAEIRLTKEQTDAIVQQTQAEFDLAHAKERAQMAEYAVTAPLDRLERQRRALQEQIALLRELGRNDEADALVEKLEEVDVRLQRAAASAIAFYRSRTPEQLKQLGIDPAEIETIILGLERIQIEAREVQKILGIGVDAIRDSFENGLNNAIDSFFEKVRSGENVFKSLLDVVRQFAAGFLLELAKMIQQQLIFNLVTGIFRAWSGGGSIGKAKSSVSAGLGALFHGGGVAGMPAQTRNVSPAWFVNATRYHRGGIAGLAPDEVPAILRRGEEVLREDNPRHRNNAGGNTGSAPVVKVINAIDAGDMVRKGLASKSGEQAFLNLIRDNPGAVRQAMERG